jgi:D-sedoheptulose 7-phosphate isomerase
MQTVAEKLWQAYQSDKQIFIFGNGGSASTASHMACDLAKGVSVKAKKRFKVQSLCDNVPIMTAWANDISYDDIFKEQLENLMNPEDIIIAISASGNSPNIVKAVEFAKAAGAFVIGFTGFSGGRLKDLSNLCMHFPINHYGQVEDLHLICEHILADCMKERVKK